MEKRPTIKDIAAQGKVSTGTVHLALSGKPGISDETRKNICRIAREIGYQPNYVAAGLKRKALRIAVVLPVQTSENRFYFTYQWDGVRDCLSGMRDFNLQLISGPYYEGQLVPAELLDSIRETEHPDALLCAGFLDARAVAAIKRYEAAGLPVVLLGADVPGVERLCCVIPPYEVIGKVLSEILLNRAGTSGRYLIGTGNVNLPSHYLVVQGFEAYAEAHGGANRIAHVPTRDTMEKTEEAFLAQLEKESFAGCCAVTARDSVALARAIERAGLAGKIAAIGSDVFPESVEYLKKGVFCNLIQKNPYQQAYLAMQYLTDWLLRAEKPPMDVVWVGSEVVYHSSLPLYDNGFYRLLT